MKDKIEYSIIPDIRYLIKSEEEIDVAVEDSPREEEEIALDGTELKIEQIRNGDYKLGIDVSKYNKTIDWNKVKAAGIDFAIIRLGYRGYSSGQLVEDPYFRQNIEGAIAAGIEVGVYFFTQAINEMEAVEEASMVLELCKDYQLTYPMFIDTEASGGNGSADLLDKSTRTLVCRALCETIASAGHKTGVYARKNCLLNNIDVREIDQ